MTFASKILLILQTVRCSPMGSKRESGVNPEQYPLL